MKKALIVANDPHNRNFLEKQYREAGYHPVSYLHPDAYFLALHDYRPALLVVDLTIPMEPKLAVIARARQQYPDLSIIVIGKSEFLRGEGLLQNDPNITLVAEITALKVECCRE